jgi:PAS domain S-box-containing protein
MNCTAHTILVVDDTPTSLKLASECLAEVGYEILVAQDGQSGLKIAREAQPDLILMDVMMPGMDGLEACRMLKTDPETSAIPVIFMTALADVDHKIQGFEAGGVDYITKPFQLAEVLARVQTHLTLSSVQKQLEAQNQRLQDEIEQRHRTGQALEESEERLRTLINAMQDMVIFKDAQGGWLEANRFALDLFNLDQESYHGKTDSDLATLRPFYQESFSACANTDEAVWQAAAATRVERIVPHPDAPERIFDVIKVPTFHRDGRRKGLIAVGRDVTDRKQAEKQMQQSHAELEQRVAERTAALRQANLQLIEEIEERKQAERDSQRRNRELALLNQIIAASLTETKSEVIMQTACRELAQLFNLPRAAAILLSHDKSQATVVAEYPGPDSDRYRQESSILNQVILVAENPAAQYLLERKECLVSNDTQNDPRLAAVRDLVFMRQARSLLLTPLILKGEVVGCISLEALDPHRFAEEQILLTRSVTDQVSGVLTRIQLNEERRELEGQYLQAQKMEALGKLTGGVAHDFNNILTVIMGVIELMNIQQGPNSPLRARLEQVHTAAVRAADLVRQLLAFSRQQILQPQVLNLNEVIANFGKMLQRVIGEDVTLETVCDPQLGQIMADPGQIEQVLMNLVVNARDAMPRGGSMTIETANVDLDESYARHHVGITPGPYVRLVISDTGVGMDETTRARIFEPFFTTKAKGEGTGLGLSTVHGIINQSGGHIWVYSEPGQGTSFKIYLPRLTAPAQQKPSNEPEASVGGGSETILVVEDEAIVRKLLHDTLTMYGYRILEADSGAKAQQIYAEHSGTIDLLLTDVVIPGGQSGPQLAAVLTARQPSLKVLYMSGYTDNAIVHQGVLDPGIAFIQKPFVPVKLAAKVRKVLDTPASAA